MRKGVLSSPGELVNLYTQSANMMHTLIVWDKLDAFIGWFSLGKTRVQVYTQSLTHIQQSQRQYMPQPQGSFGALQGQILIIII